MARPYLCTYNRDHDLVPIDSKFPVFLLDPRQQVPKIDFTSPPKTLLFYMMLTILFKLVLLLSVIRPICSGSFFTFVTCRPFQLLLRSDLDRDLYIASSLALLLRLPIFRVNTPKTRLVSTSLGAPVSSL